MAAWMSHSTVQGSTQLWLSAVVLAHVLEPPASSCKHLRAANGESTQTQVRKILTTPVPLLMKTYRVENLGIVSAFAFGFAQPSTKQVLLHLCEVAGVKARY